MSAWYRLQRFWQHRQLKDERYAFLFDDTATDEVMSIDCETTGLNPKKDDIISLSAIKIRGSRIQTSESLQLTLKPSKNIDQAAIKVHHLRNCDVADGLSAQEAMQQFLQFIGNRPLLGYYLEFDVALLNRLIKPMIGCNLPNPQIELSALYHDYKIERIPQRHVDLRFQAIREHLDIPDLGTHDAFADALMVAMAYVKLQQRIHNKR